MSIIRQPCKKICHERDGDSTSDLSLIRAISLYGRCFIKQFCHLYDLYVWKTYMINFCSKTGIGGQIFSMYPLINKFAA